MNSEDNNPTSVNHSLSISGILIGYVERVGLPSAVLVFYMTIFIVYMDAAQKKEFIDKYFLFKGSDEKPIFCVIVVVFISLASLMIIYYQSKMLKQKSEDLRRIGQEKSDLQAALIDRELNTSK